MRYIRRPSWWLPESAATPEPVFWNRRAFMAGAGLAGVGALAPGLSGGGAALAADMAGEPFDPKPALNPDFADAGRAITDETASSTYNNFYEFGFHKGIYKAAQKLPTDGWTVTLDGEVEEERQVGIEDLLAKAPLEERVIRHRCVEAWSMVVPWIGFPLAHLIDMAKPLSSAKYVRFETFMNPEVAPEQNNPRYPWPYVEGLTIEEAANPLTMAVVGAYGKVLPKQFGAPIRIHVPWKYGFKSGKSITRISFTSEQPVGLWEELQSSEYGFWANVNPEVSHPRWSQAQERVLGTGTQSIFGVFGEELIPTQLYNGYGEEVAHLYADKQDLGDALYR